MRMTLPVFLVLMLATVVSGQVWLDKFSYQNGTTVGTWKEDRGDWTVNNTVAQAEIKFQWQYATQPKLMLRDCVAQCLVTHNSGAKHTLQFGGIALRCVAPAADSSLVMVKVQNNASATNPTKFDSIWLYTRNCGTTKSTVNLTPFPQAKVRLTVLDNRTMAEVDTDLDGIWEYRVVTSLSVIFPAAPVGICGFGGVHIDDYELFDAVLMHDVGTAKPNPGNEVKMVMRGGAKMPYIAVSALGNRGFPISKTAKFPLSPDTLFGVTAQNVLPTVFKNYQGVLDTKGDGKLSVQIPNIAALKGVTIFTAFVTYGSGQIANVSNDFQFTIT